jgi:hypothetical protein
MHALAMFDVLGLLVLFVTLVCIGALQVAAALGLMYGMHKLTPDKLTETQYGDFDFDNFQNPALINLIVKLAVIFLGATLIIHIADFLIIGTLIRKYKMIVCFVLFLLETGTITLGLHLVFKLDKYRWMVLTGGSAFFYLFCLWYLSKGAGFLS